MMKGIRPQHSTRSEQGSRQSSICSDLAGWRWIWVTTAVTLAALTQPAFAAQNQPSPAIAVQISNYSRASPAELAAAEREAGRILEQAGVRASWLQCPAASSTQKSQEPCQKALEPGEVRLQILAEPTQNTFQDSVFGFALHPLLAGVYYKYVMLRARSDNAEFEVPTILGCVMAHEIGHLLLGPNSHSSAGIMQAQWKPGQVRQLNMGTLLFTPEQSKLLRAAAQARSEYRTLISASSTP